MRLHDELAEMQSQPATDTEVVPVLLSKKHLEETGEIRRVKPWPFVFDPDTQPVPPGL
jgi:hypothetical protein